jgi:hypothetical protein
MPVCHRHLQEKIPQIQLVEGEGHYVECWNIDEVIKDLDAQKEACE